MSLERETDQAIREINGKTEFTNILLGKICNDLEQAILKQRSIVLERV